MTSARSGSCDARSPQWVRPDDRRFELKDKERRAPVRTVSAVALGVIDTARADAANKLEYLYAENLDPPGCWLGCEGGIGAWLAARRQAGEKEKLRKQEEARRARRSGGS